MTGWSTDHMFYVDKQYRVWSADAAAQRGHEAPTTKVQRPEQNKQIQDPRMATDER